MDYLNDILSAVPDLARLLTGAQQQRQPPLTAATLSQQPNAPGAPPPAATAILTTAAPTTAPSPWSSMLPVAIGTTAPMIGGRRNVGPLTRLSLVMEGGLQAYSDAQEQRYRANLASEVDAEADHLQSETDQLRAQKQNLTIGRKALQQKIDALPAGDARDNLNLQLSRVETAAELQDVTKSYMQERAARQPQGFALAGRSSQSARRPGGPAGRRHPLADQ